MMGRKKSVSLDDPLTAKAVELYRNGATVKRAAKEAFLSPEGFRYRLWVLGIQTRGTRRGKPLPPEIIEEIRRERKAGKTYKQISCDYKISIKTVCEYTKDIIPDYKPQIRRKRVFPSGDPNIQKAIELYENGATVREAAAAICISECALSYRFKCLGFPLREPGKKKLSPELVERIRREYRDGKSFYRIAKDLGISAPTVRKYIK